MGKFLKKKFLSYHTLPKAIFKSLKTIFERVRMTVVANYI